MEQNEMIMFDEVEAREVFAHGDAEEIDTSDFYASQQRISQNPTVLSKH